MANQYDPRFSAAPLSTRSVDADVDVGLRRYMLGVYNMMALGVALTGLVSFFVGTNDTLMQLLYGTPLRYVVMFAPLAVVLYFSVRLNRMSAAAAQTTFWVYAGLVGLSLAYIFRVYTGGLIAQAFFVSAGAFAGLSLFGYTTNRNLSAMGTFLIMGVFGLIIAQLVNMFFHSPAVSQMITYVGLLLFAGLTAYDTQMIKAQYYAGGDSETVGKRVVVGALSLYLDFINMFLFILRIFGGNRN